MGLTIDDCGRLDIGMILDFMQEYIERQEERHNMKKNKTRKATQKDFDVF